MIRALIAVYQCDLCGELSSVDKLIDENLVRFEAEWHLGKIKQFCGHCKTTAVAIDWIREEPRIIARYDRVSRETSGGEYAN